MATKIVLTGAGSGGHLFPLISVTKKIREQDPNTKFLFIGPITKMEKEVLDGQGIRKKGILSGKLYRYFTFRYFTTLLNIPLGFFQSLWHLLWFMPDVVFAKGGFASVPVVMAAWLYRIPILIHESDAKPGLANRFSGSLANQVAITFERAKIHFPPSKTIITGNPINENTLGGNAEEGRRILGMSKEIKPTILILGGSQGAQIINKKIVSILPSLTKRFQVVHQTGKNNYEEIVSLAARKGFKKGHSDYYPIGFLREEMKHIMALADVVISRAGATSIAEIAANKKVAILVPILHSANNHQKINAFEVSRVGGAVVIEETNLKKHILLNELKRIVENQEIRNQLISKIQKFYHPKAADYLAEIVLTLAR